MNNEESANNKRFIGLRFNPPESEKWTHKQHFVDLINTSSPIDLIYYSQKMNKVIQINSN